MPVTGGNVTLPDSAAATPSANVTCTVANQLADGSLRIGKVVDAPAGAYTGGATKAFTGTYDCGAGFTGPFTRDDRDAGRRSPTSRPAAPAPSPRRRRPAAWPTPRTPGDRADLQRAAGDDHRTARRTVTITNPVVQKFGTFAITKTTGPRRRLHRRYRRVFPVALLLHARPAARRRRDPRPHDGAGRVAGDAHPDRLGLHVHRDAHRPGRGLQRPELRLVRLHRQPGHRDHRRQHHGDADDHEHLHAPVRLARGGQGRPAAAATSAVPVRTSPSTTTAAVASSAR